MAKCGKTITPTNKVQSCRTLACHTAHSLRSDEIKERPNSVVHFSAQIFFIEIRRCESIYRQEIWSRRRKERREKIKVFLRVKLTLAAARSRSNISLNGDSSICINTNSAPQKTFSFDSIFPPSASQESIFAATRPLVAQTLKGYNGCIFAYGQTGSGKTHTMIGGENGERGILPRTLDMLFSAIHDRNRKGTEKVTVRISAVEIYMEKIKDLFDPDAGTKFSGEHKRNSHVQNLVRRKVESSEAAQHSLKTALRQRISAKTGMNASSSRSHVSLQFG